MTPEQLKEIKERCRTSLSLYLAREDIKLLVQEVESLQALETQIRWLVSQLHTLTGGLP